jgi:hypothetical protein
MQAKEETGKRHGRLTVLRRAGSTDKAALWLCLCDCGTQCKVIGKSLRNGDARSCGCLQRERSSQANRRPPKERVLRSRNKEVLTIVKKREPYVGGFDRSGFLCGEPPSWLRIGVA